MDGDRRVVHVLGQRLAQHTHVLFKMVPQEAEDIAGPGVDHVTNSLPRDTNKTPERYRVSRLHGTCEGLNVAPSLTA